jgi:type I restriction enzyme S subunit
LERIDFEKHKTGSTIPHVYYKDYKSEPFPLVELPEQKRIVAILDEAFEAIDQAKANIERNIENAEELFQSKLKEVFSQRGDGWKEKKMGDICSVLNGYAFKSKEAIETSNTQLLRMGNLYQNKLDLDRRPVFYPDSYVEEYQKYLLGEGDLIMSLTGTVDKTDYGYTVEVPDTDVNLLLNQRIMKITIEKPDVINKGFLKNYLLSPFFLKKLYATASGTRQANLSSRKIMKLSVHFPKDILTQKRIVQEVQSLKSESDRLLRSYKLKWKNLQELKKSILQKAFAGALTGQVVESGWAGLEDGQDGVGSMAAELKAVYEAGE